MIRSLRCRISLIAVVFLVLIWNDAYSSNWPNDPETNLPIGIASNNQTDPQIVSDGTGGFIVVWNDGRSILFYQIYAQRITAGGDVAWSQDGVAICAGEYHSAHPRLVSDDSGGAIIAWTDRRSGKDDIYAQRVDATGTLLWASTGVPICTAAEYQSADVIVSDGSGGAIIAWGDPRNGPHDLYAQRVDANGATLWDPDGIAVCAADGYQGPGADGMISYDSDGVIIVWGDTRNGTDRDIYAQRVSLQGNSLWLDGGVPVVRAGNDQHPTDVATDGDGGAIVTWYDDRSGDFDVYVQRVGSDGNILWSAEGVEICMASDYQGLPQLTPDGSGGAIIAWQDWRNGFNANDIFAQRVNAGGHVMWDIDGVVVCDAVGPQSWVRLVPDGSGGAILQWGDPRAASSDLYAQRVDANGNMLWIANGVPITTAPDEQYFHRLVSDGAGGGVVVWHDKRDGDYDIYAQQIDADGLLGGAAQPPKPDFIVGPIEVAQAVVSPDLLRGKDTVVRAYPQNIGALLNYWPLITGTLHVLDENNNELFTRPAHSGVWWPSDGVFENLTIWQGQNSLNFYLDKSEITASEYKFWVEIDDIHAIDEQDETNNSTQANPTIQQFRAPSELRIAYCSVSPDMTPFHTPQMSQACELIAETFPVDFEYDEDWNYMSHFKWDATHAWVERAQIRLWRELQRLNMERRVSDQPTFHRIVGFFKKWPLGDVLGKSSLNKSVVMLDASIATDDYDGPELYRTTLAHEIGHTFGLVDEYYSWNDNDGKWRAGSPDGDPNVYHLKIDDCAPGAFPCRNFPARGRSEGIVRGRFVDESTFDVASKRPAAWAPLSVRAWTDKTIIRTKPYLDPGDDNLVIYWLGDEHAELVADRRRIGFMGRAGHGDDFAWISSDDYNLLVENLPGPGGSGGSPEPASGEFARFSTDSSQVWITALISVDDHVEAPHWDLVETGLTTDVLTGTDYSVEFVGAGGTTLASHPFDLEFTDQDTLAFFAALPFPAGTEHIEIRKASLPIFVRDVSTNSPTVTLTAPNGGALSGPVTIRWSASDLDGDSTTANLFYSPNDGSSWHSIALDVEGDSLTWDTDSIPGTPAGLVRVIVSDGVNIAEDDSDNPFTVGGKAPSVSITAPGDSATVVAGEEIDLEGVLIDPEDGTAPSAGLVWISSLDDTLGVGPMLIITTLQPGTHTVTASGTDYDGMSAQDSITLVVLQDSDGDGMPDDWEDLYTGVDASLPDGEVDVDDDGLSNSDEYVVGTDPTDDDSDNDGFEDGVEVVASTDPLSAASTPTSIAADDRAVALSTKVSSYPNPFNPTTTVRIEVPVAGPTNLRVYDVRGRLVVQLFSEFKTAGQHHVQWNGRNSVGDEVASGVYFLRLHTRAGVATSKALILR